MQVATPGQGWVVPIVGAIALPVPGRGSQQRFKEKIRRPNKSSQEPLTCQTDPSCRHGPGPARLAG